MTVSPKKTHTKTTASRGVEARADKESRYPERKNPEELHQHGQMVGTEGDGQSAGLLSASYVQVLVQKHQRPSVRLPSASSPNHPGAEDHTRPEQARPLVYQCQCGVGRMSRGEPSAAVFISCPTLAALRHQTYNIAGELEAETVTGDAGVPVPRLSDCKVIGSDKPNKKKNKPFWTKLSGSDEVFDGPDRIEVYHGEHDCGLLCSRTPRETYVERKARAFGRHAGALCDELLAMPRLLLQIPISILLRFQSCVLVTVRGAVTGAVQTTSDQVLKPALALLTDAVLRPPLLCAARVAAALRYAVRPLWLALGDAIEPLSQLLAQIRLVTVEYRCPCENKCSCEHAV